MDDFGIKYTDEADLEHLMSVLRTKYEMTLDTDAKQYVGIDLAWDYSQRELICSMDSYIKSGLSEFQHPTPKQFYYSPSKFVRPEYGAKVQYVKHDDSGPLSADQIKKIQKVVGKFLFMVRAVDHTMLHPLNDIACAASKGTKATMEATTYFLNYVACNPLPRIKYRASI